MLRLEVFALSDVRGMVVVWRFSVVVVCSARNDLHL